MRKHKTDIKEISETLKNLKAEVKDNHRVSNGLVLRLKRPLIDEERIFLYSLYSNIACITSTPKGYPELAKSSIIILDDKKAGKIIKCIKENGGLDLKHMEFCARADHRTFNVNYVSEWIKMVYCCHGNTANAVARYFYY